MQQIILVYDSNYKCYRQYKIFNGGIVHLTTFLTDDVGCHAIKFYKDWLNAPDEKDAGGNYSHLEKQDDKILLSFNDDWFHEVPNAPVFETTVEELSYILDRWQEACEKKPKKIIIMRDNGKIAVDFED